MGESPKSATTTLQSDDWGGDVNSNEELSPSKKILRPTLRFTTADTVMGEAGTRKAT